MREVGEPRALAKEAAKAAETRQEDARARVAEGIEETVGRVKEEE